MILRRFDNSRAILPVTKSNRDLFDKTGVIHFKRCLSEGNLKKLQQQLINLFDNRERDKSFHDIHLGIALKAFKNFELESVLAQYTSDLLKSEHVFLYDDRLIAQNNSDNHQWRTELKHWPITGQQACCVWIPMAEAPASFEFRKQDASQIIQMDLGDCIIFHAATPYRRGHLSELNFRDGLMVYIVGDDVSAAMSNTANSLRVKS